MNPLLWMGTGGLVAYLLLRAKGGAGSATVPGPTTGVPNEGAASGAASPSSAPAVVNAPGKSSVPQLTATGPRSTGEIATGPQATVIRLGGRWGWPVPRYQGRAPVISDGFGSNRPTFPGGKHRGVDLMFARIASDRIPIGPSGTKGFIMPDAWMAVAAADGVVWSAGYTQRGGAIVIDHGDVATFYTHLETIFFSEAKPPEPGTPKHLLLRVKAGQPLGVIGADPLDPQRLRHLHFEMWAGGPDKAIDPAPLMKSWEVFGPDDVAPYLPSAARNAAKKAGKHPDLVNVVAHRRSWPGTAIRPGR